MSPLSRHTRQVNCQSILLKNQAKTPTNIKKIPFLQRFLTNRMFVTSFYTANMTNIQIAAKCMCQCQNYFKNYLRKFSVFKKHFTRLCSAAYITSLCSLCAQIYTKTVLQQQKMKLTKMISYSYSYKKEPTSFILQLSQRHAWTDGTMHET